MFCSNCGKLIDDDANFCPRCGMETSDSYGKGNTIKLDQNYDAERKKPTLLQNLNGTFLAIIIFVLLCTNWLDLPMVGGCTFIIWPRYIEAADYIGIIFSDYETALYFTYIAPISTVMYLFARYKKVKNRDIFIVGIILGTIYNIVLAYIITEANNRFVFGGESVLHVSVSAFITIIFSFLLASSE
ncbi:zinc ribbon domain-containing protein [Enterocloster lavalensis]|uniref:zinc ribbon domain-containing protein n=1 Tax=Enterocloster lavalensis TaxID=460384 RepID=UPI0026658F12|nr:zinc ribbon domain-containing protein [Enterocloster lavalensis]